MSKKKNDLSEFEDIFKDLKKDAEEVETLLAQAKAEPVEVAKQVIEKHKDTFEKLAKTDTTARAFGVHKDEETGQWCVAEVHFNPLTGEAKVHNDRVITNLSKAVIGVRAQELMTRAHNGLSLRHAKGYKG
jgi:hypothetical protein